MAEATTTETETPAQTEAEQEAAAAKEAEEQRVPYERFEKANKKAKDAEARAGEAEKAAAKLREQIEEREQAGMPELDQLKKRLEAAEKRATDAESKAQESDQRADRVRREQWVSQAAAKANFVDADDAARYVNLDDIEDADSAERAVKKIAKAKAHLVKDEEPTLPGQVLKGGLEAKSEAAKKAGAIDLGAEAQELAEGLRQFVNK